MSKSNSARPYNIPSNTPNYTFRVKDVTYKFFKEWNEYTMFQEKDGHIQRVKLTESNWYGMIDNVRNIIEADKQANAFLANELYE